MEGKPTGQEIIARLLRDPDNWELRLAAAATLATEGRQGEAVSILDAAPNPPDSEPELLQCAEVYAQTQPAKAVTLLHAWLQAHPNAPVVHLAMADTALRLGDQTGARAYYQRAIEIQPEYRDPDLEVRYGLAAPPVHAPVGEPKVLPTAGSAPSPAPAAAPKKNAASPLGGLISLGTAIGVFLLGWLFVALALRAMLAHQ